MPSGTATVRRSRVRRAGESAFGMLLLAKVGLMAALAILLVVAGVWTSLDTAGPATFAGAADRGTLTVTDCSGDTCHGSFRSDTPDPPVRDVGISTTVAEEGDTLEVALRREAGEAVRTGPAGILYAWVPLGGALLLASLVIAGGLRMRRTAWAAGLAGAGVMVGAFALL